MTAMFLLVDSGLMSSVRGWIRRAERLLEGHPAGAVHAVLAAVRTYERFLSGDMEAARRYAPNAIELGERHDVMAAVAMGRTASGRMTVLDGDVDGGLGELDEVAALLMSGDVDAMTTGMMYCELICAAQGVARSDRADEWTAVMERWCPTRAFGGIQGRCRVHRAELLRLLGPCDEAEGEALRACDELRPWMRREFGWPLVELGSIRLRRGDLAGAEEAFVAAHDHGWPPHPGLALVRLEQGEATLAADLIAASIAHPVDAPSKEIPPFGDLRLAPLLDAQAEIAAATGDMVVLEAAASALVEIAGRYASPGLAAGADLAAARVALLTGDASTTIDLARQAAAGFGGLGAVFDVGRARTVLANALERAGDLPAARMELLSAQQCYETYGAVRRAAELTERLLRPTPVSAGPVVPGLRGVFRFDGSAWIVELAGVQARVKDLKGIRYLRRLVGEPGREFHVLDLVAVEHGTLRTGSSQQLGELSHRHGESGLPVIDQAARDAYRRRLADVDEDIEEATQRNDLGRLEKAEADRRYLIRELTSAVGLGGQTRTVGSSSERARTSVARSVHYALNQIADRHAAFAEHVRSSVHTGTYCTYRPDPLATVCWDL